jgi:hypothetical protein
MVTVDSIKKFSCGNLPDGKVFEMRRPIAREEKAST